MKLIILVDCDAPEFDDMIRKVRNRKIILTNTQSCDEVTEHAYLVNEIERFSQSDREIMLARFSGKEATIQNLGDEFAEMIISLSCRKCSKYYTEHPTNTLSDLVTIFEKGD